MYALRLHVKHVLTKEVNLIELELCRRAPHQQPYCKLPVLFVRRDVPDGQPGGCEERTVKNSAGMGIRKDKLKGSDERV